LPTATDGDLFTMKLLHFTKDTILGPSRILKESYTLLQKCNFKESIVIGLQSNTLPVVETVDSNQHFIRIEFPFKNLKRGLLRTLFKLYNADKAAHNAIVYLKPDLIIAHSLATLTASTKAAKKLRKPVIYDCHELELGTHYSKRLHYYLAVIIERMYIYKVDGVFVSNESIATWYEKKYPGIKPLVVRPLPDTRWQSNEKSDLFRQSFGIPSSHYIFLYQGIFSTGRRIEQLIEVFKNSAEDRHLVFMGFGELQQQIEDACQQCNRIHFQPSVPPSIVLKYTSSADVSICGVENTCLHNYMSLPNKLIESILAGVPSLVPNGVEMVKHSVEIGCGWVHGESTDDILNLVNSLSRDEISVASKNCELQRSKLTWESQEASIVDYVNRIIHR
jgi:glycosyltransferase involved in cell wall biosynthesis